MAAIGLALLLWLLSIFIKWPFWVWLLIWIGGCILIAASDAQEQAERDAIVHRALTTKKCKACAEDILKEAKKCKHCGELQA